jgi:uncharacterized protein (TIGR03435 family)
VRAIITEASLAIGGSFALSLLVKATLTLSAALLACRFARRTRAAARHVLLTAAFAILCALPVASVAIPSRVVELAVPTVPAAPAVLVVPFMPDEAAPAGRARQALASQPTAWAGVPITALLIGAWMLGAIAVIAPLLAGIWQARSMRDAAAHSSRSTALASALAADAGIRRRLDVLVHPSIRGPMTFGVVRPKILLPADVDSWSDEELRQALIHELEHVRRSDWVTLCFARIVCALYWFHPLVWIAWHHLRLEAERACDDAVLRRADPTAYADQLVLLAKRLATATASPLLAMAACQDLTTRVRAVLDAAQTRGRAGAACVAGAIVTAALLVAAIAPLRAAAQDQPGTAAQGPPLAFETASVKPNKSGEEERFIRIDPRGGSLTVTNLQLRELITFAYQIQRFQLEGGPDWIASDRFDILAKPEREVPGTGAFFSGQEPLRMMLRTLLADRFKLAMHKETKELPIFELVLARQDGKLGPQLRPAAADCAARAAAAKAGTPPPAEPGPPGPGSCGITMNPVRVAGGGVTLAMLAGLLEGPAQRVVIDRTGLRGNWDLEVNYTPDQSQVPPGVELPPSIDRNGPSLFTALEEQLGLKLRPARGPVEVLVIDNVEPPSEN